MSLKRGNIREMEDYIDPANAEKDCLKVIAKVMPRWNLEEVKFKPCPCAGFVNTMLICYTEDDADDWIIFRISGEGFDYMFDHKAEIAATKTLHMAGISPFVHCIFKNGICMEFIKGKSHTWTDLSDWKDVKIFKSVARELARIHSQDVRDIAIQCGFDPKKELKRRENMMIKLGANWPTEIGEKEADELTSILSLSTYKSEIYEMEELFKELFPTLTFVHGETNPTNILYVERTDRAVLVDYDFTEFGYFTYDIAVFLEFSAVGMTPDVDGTLRHSDEYIKVFLREYLETKRSLDLSETGHVVTDTDVERLFVQTMKTVLYVYLVYSFGFVQIAAGRNERHGVRKKDMVGLSCLLYGWYAKHKEQIMAMEVPPLELAKATS